MARNNISFVNSPGGLGRLPATEDHVSAIIIDLAASPAGWSDLVAQKYLSLQEAEAHGIIDGDANYGILWYFIREFFRVSGPAVLYVVNEGHANYDVNKFFEFTEGKVRQAFVYNTGNFAALDAKVGTLQTLANNLETLHAPLSVITNVIDEATAIDGASQSDLRALNSNNVSVIIAGDGSGKGFEIATALGMNYLPAGGTLLGALAKANVHENIGWVARFNLAQGSDFQSTVLADGSKLGSTAGAILDTLHDKGYIFTTRHIGIAGSYFVDSHTTTLETSDLAFIENVRTINKAKRDIRSILLPDLNAPLYVDPQGKVSPSTVKYFESKTARPLNLMQNAGELSGFSVTIDPEQDVLATSKLIIQVKLQPVGVARFIEVNIGFTVSIDS